MAGQELALVGQPLEDGAVAIVRGQRALLLPTRFVLVAAAAVGVIAFYEFDQIAIANEVFAPTKSEIEEARESMEAYRRSEAEGVGAIGREGKLVDAAHMRLAANVLYKASLAGKGESR